MGFGNRRCCCRLPARRSAVAREGRFGIYILWFGTVLARARYRAETRRFRFVFHENAPRTICMIQQLVGVVCSSSSSSSIGSNRRRAESYRKNPSAPHALPKPSAVSLRRALLTFSRFPASPFSRRVSVPRPRRTSLPTYTII